MLKIGDTLYFPFGRLLVPELPGMECYRDQEDGDLCIHDLKDRFCVRLDDDLNMLGDAREDAKSGFEQRTYRFGNASGTLTCPSWRRSDVGGILYGTLCVADKDGAPMEFRLFLQRSPGISAEEWLALPETEKLLAGVKVLEKPYVPELPKEPSIIHLHGLTLHVPAGVLAWKQPKENEHSRFFWQAPDKSCTLEIREEPRTLPICADTDRFVQETCEQGVGMELV